MRLTGTLRSWDDDRGFGFIAPTQGGRELFVHISAFPPDGSRPTLGEKLSYELGTGGSGKPQAVKIGREALSSPTVRRYRAHQPKPSRRRVPALFAVVILAMVVAGYVYNKHLRLARSAALRESQTPKPVASMESPLVTATTDYRCDGRTYCSQMTSCAEATFFLRNCPGTKMDGNGDGVPCEQQWCTSPFAR